ncbi:MAG: PhnD/SsuA/transferrin family substrate-binding protein, partial [Casimicrobiaceae bacterium]
SPSAWALDSIRIGVTPVFLADQAAFLARWRAYLSERTGLPVEFVARDSYQSILNLLLSMRLDAAWLCGYPYIRFEQVLDLLAVPLYRGEPTYQAYLIRSKKTGSSIGRWSDLRGRVLAYSDPMSNSGWLVAQAQLSRAGLTSADLRRTFFSHGHRNTTEAVAAGLADAGAVDGYVWETMLEQGMAAARATEVVWRSEAFGFPPLVTRKREPHPLTPLLRQALLGMSGDDAGRRLLKSLNLSGFMLGRPDLFEGIRSLAREVTDGAQGG